MTTDTEFRIGIDIGGTFTDFTVIDSEGGVFLWKEDSDPDNPTRAIERGLEAVADNLELEVADLLGRTSLLVHGTTIATNTVIQRNGPKIGLLCTEGFRDILFYRDGFKPDRFNIHMEHPRSLVERHLRLPVHERMDRSGNVVVPLDEDSVRAAVAEFKAKGVKSISVAFLWSIVNPAHEHRAAEIVREEIPDAHVVCSSDILPEIREWQRTSSAVLSAYVLPGIADYLRSFEVLLSDAGYAKKPQIMQVNGGCASVSEIIRRPVNVLGSGPAAAPAAAQYYGGRHKWDGVVTVDMGGTSFDVCLIRGEHATMSRELAMADQPIGVPGVEVHSVGAGGGSIAWIDSGGALRVGPASAGANPGPAAYGAGGEFPTVTDANIVLGYMAPSAFLGGRRELDVSLARKAIEKHVASPLGLDVVEAASGIIRVTNANMTRAIREVSVERGVDPRRFMCVAGGGAGGLHAVNLARQLGISRVLIPREAGTLCAFGMTVTDVRHDTARALRMLSDNSEDLRAVDDVFAAMEMEVRDRLREEGFADEQIRLERSVDARYPGQVHELTIQVPSSPHYTDEDARTIETTFHSEHERQFTYSRPELAVECLHWRVAGIGRGTVPDVKYEVEGTEGGLVGEREIFLPVAKAMGMASVYQAERLPQDQVVEGPAILQAKTTTVLLGEGDHLVTQQDGSFLIDVAAKRLAAEHAEGAALNVSLA